MPTPIPTTTKQPCCSLAYCPDASRINAAIVSGQTHTVTAALYDIELPALLEHVKHLKSEGWPTTKHEAVELTDLQKRLAAFQAKAAVAIALASEGEVEPSSESEAGEGTGQRDSDSATPQKGTVNASGDIEATREPTKDESASSVAKRASNEATVTVVADGVVESGQGNGGHWPSGEPWREADAEQSGSGAGDKVGEGTSTGKALSNGSMAYVRGMATAESQVCCYLASHPQVMEINADLLACIGSVRGLATKYSVDHTAIQRHKVHVGLRITSPIGKPLTVDEAIQFTQRHTTLTRGQSAASDPMVSAIADEASSMSDASTMVVNPSVIADTSTITDILPVLRSVSASGQNHSRLQPLIENENLRKQLGERIGQIANLVALDKWNDRATVLGLVKQWGCSEQEVERLYAIATSRVRSSRGNLASQLEVAVATYKGVISNAKTYAKSCYHSSQAAQLRGKPGEAKQWASLAATTASTIANTQKALDAVTIAKTQALTIQVGVTADPDFAGAFRLIARGLDALYPGGSSDVEHLLELWEVGGDAVADAWLRKEKARREAAALMLPAHKDVDSGEGM